MKISLFSDNKLRMNFCLYSVPTWSSEKKEQIKYIDAQ